VIDVRRLKRTPLPVNHGFVVLINPELLRGEGEQVPREGCLSVPDLLANVRRFARVVVKTETFEGTTTTIESEGFEALAFQHELDHLQGRLFLDRVANLKTDIFRRKTLDGVVAARRQL
jgi:peptide deformylase